MKFGRLRIAVGLPPLQPLGTEVHSVRLGVNYEFGR
jgi:hypothetical protein